MTDLCLIKPLPLFVRSVFLVNAIMSFDIDSLFRMTLDDFSGISDKYAPDSLIAICRLAQTLRRKEFFHNKRVQELASSLSLLPTAVTAMFDSINNVSADSSSSGGSNISSIATHNLYSDDNDGQQQYNHKQAR